MYAFGCLCLEVGAARSFAPDVQDLIRFPQIYTHQHPFPDCDKDAQVISAVLSGQRPQLPHCTTSFQKSVFKLAEYCWLENPSERPDTRFVSRNLKDTTNAVFEYDIIFSNGDSTESPVQPLAHRTTLFSPSLSCDDNPPVTVGSSGPSPPTNPSPTPFNQEASPMNCSPWSMASTHSSPFILVSAHSSPFFVVPCHPNGSNTPPFMPTQT